VLISAVSASNATLALKDPLAVKGNRSLELQLDPMMIKLPVSFRGQELIAQVTGHGLVRTPLSHVISR
jgi:hypothetical protein